jgi:hypothetical protein
MPPLLLFLLILFPLLLFSLYASIVYGAGRAITHICSAYP